VCSDSDINLTEDHPCFQRTSYHIIAESRDALNAAAAQAQVLGFDTSIISDKIEGEARTTAHEHLNMILPLLSSQQPQCFLFGGETTVTVTGNGLGGRNQEYILSLIDKIQEMDGLFIMSSGTDGIDGPTDAAGAWIDGSSSMRAERRRLEPLQTLANNDAYNFFKALNQLIITGPTGTNVMDIAIYLWFPR
jgi:hydroxypyruvate reductase